MSFLARSGKARHGGAGLGRARRGTAGHGSAGQVKGIQFVPVAGCVLARQDKGGQSFSCRCSV